MRLSSLLASLPPELLVSEPLEEDPPAPFEAGLRALPYAKLCIDCKRDVENGGPH